MSYPKNDVFHAEEKPGKALHQIMLRDKFMQLSKNLEEEISSVIEVQMKGWKDENLPSGVSISTQSSPSSVTAALTNSLSTKRRFSSGQLPSRVFVARPSLLTELLTELVEEAVKTGSVDLRLSYLSWAFGKFDKVLIIWIAMKFSTLVGVYLGFHFWAYNRHKAPVYRDEYPRNESCSWGKVMKEFAQVIGCLTYAHFLLTRFCGPVFEKFGKEEFSQTKLLMAVFASSFPASLVLLCGFFLVLHAWMNAFAEMLRFADRLFYKDWWNSTSYPRFYRTWNCVVHDWLYEYVYKELTDLQMRKKGFLLRLKFLPMLVVFFISSVVHEYIMAFALRFFYPILLFMFGGFGVLFMFINTKESVYNMFIWVSLVLGAGILMCLYSMEWYARINCPPVVDGIADYFVPRSWFCF